jgi:hypothetical protein
MIEIWKEERPSGAVVLFMKDKNKNISILGCVYRTKIFPEMWSIEGIDNLVHDSYSEAMLQLVRLSAGFIAGAL